MDIKYRNPRFNFAPPPKPPKKPKSGFSFFFWLVIIIGGVYFFAAWRHEKSVSSQPENPSQSAVSQAEAKKPERILPQAADNPEYEPVRKDGASNLVIPTAHAFVVVDADTGKVLAGDHETDRKQIASLTKMMTAILVMEKIKDLDEPVEIGEEEVYVEGTKIGCPRSGYCISPRLKVGEKVTARNLLQAMLMNSANDAAIALGKHISGSQDEFAKLMNEKAEQMGLTDTHFCTPSGLEPDGRESECYSSASDIAHIAAYSMRYDEIWEKFACPNNSEITSCDGQVAHTLLNTDAPLENVPNALGAKTGFTPAAGYSLLAGAADPTGKHRVIVVVLDDPYRWQDIKSAFSWAFEAYDWKKWE